MTHPFTRRAGALAVIGFAAAAVVACSPPADEETPAPAGSSGSVDAKTATSAEAFGGMEGLVAAAKAEGKLNVIALPPDWANYGEIIKGFQAKYPEIKITSDQPDACFFNDTATTENHTIVYTLSLLDSLPDTACFYILSSGLRPWM